MSHIDQGIADAIALTAWLQQHEHDTQRISRIADAMADCLRHGGRILACGNGGSMSDAMHFAEELSGRNRTDRRALSAQAMSDPGHLTCVANDFGYDQVFARGVEAWGRRGDVLLMLSTSGNSANLLAAEARAHGDGLVVIGLLGRDGGQLTNRCDLAIIVPGRTSDRIQEVHIKIVHLLIDEIERRLFPEIHAHA
jgi:D-sedoheptulose 7-phosphate isomerase